jgi:hypothetical protein
LFVEEREEEKDEVKEEVVEDDSSRVATPEETRAFVLQYIETNRLTKASRIFGDKENALLNAAVQSRPRITSTIMDLHLIVACTTVDLKKSAREW